MDLGARRIAALVASVLVLVYLMGAVRAEEIETEPVDEPKLMVDYDPPQLSVEAHEVGLAAVLTAIGAKVGFIVVESAPSSTVVTLSIQNASLDDVLRQLLRAENHTVLYRAGKGMSAQSGAIDRIVLLGDPGATTTAATPAEGPAQERPRPAQDHRDAHPEAASPSPEPPTSPPRSAESAPLVPDGDPAPADSNEPGTLPLTVADILKVHSMAAAQAGRQVTREGAASPAVAPANLEAALAEAARRAQQGLGALLDGLATATRSLPQPRSEGGE
ncbi:MAG: hypothetical protein DMD83_21160 [Candidatus Rokuibacteriota bacterium]|nr:MAG: hypothetical protein DMD83_21160 [Candidatus Rokubacteria bacterium]